MIATRRLSPVKGNYRHATIRYRGDMVGRGHSYGIDAGQVSPGASAMAPDSYFGQEPVS
jgi:hypothetical protein